MRVLGIDPGYDRVGVAIVERENNNEKVVHSACIETDKEATLLERIFEVGSQVEALIEAHRPTVVAIETLFFNKNIKTGIGVAEARGAMVYAATKSGCSIVEFGPQEIKVAITGYGKSDKQAVIDMVKRLVKGAPERALDDEYDAIAVGVTALAHHRELHTQTTIAE